ncbi:MAG: hypothetical protein VKJ24_18875 [Synechococcales bacterium]|nr:hypothetical protein [Synechococcales bacterium]
MKRHLTFARSLIPLFYTALLVGAPLLAGKVDCLFSQSTSSIAQASTVNQFHYQQLVDRKFQLRLNLATGSGTAFDPSSGFTYEVKNWQIVGGQTTVLGKTVKFYTVKPLNFQQPTIFITHGYIVSGGSNIAVAKLYAQRYPNYNVIVMDWGSLSKDGMIPVISNGFINKEYKDAADASIAVGKKMGQLILGLRLNPNQVTLLGHSLGARASQFAAETVRQQWQNQRQIQLLILLDPAGPGFQPRLWDWIAGGWRIRQVPKDRQATKTIVIHTSDRWGDERLLGNIDVYIRKPTRTPAFQIDDHTYANQYWRELVSSGQDQILINSTAQQPVRMPHMTRIVYR